MEEKSFDFTSLILTLWKNKARIIVITAVAALAAVTVVLSMPKSYRASSTLIISESKIGTESVLSSFFNPRLFATLQGVVKNKEIVNKAMKKFNLDQKPYKLKVEDIMGLMSANVIPNTRLIRVSFTLKDPVLAADVVNFVADEAVVLNNSLNKVDIESTLETISGQLDDSSTAMNESERELETFKSEARLKALDAEIENLIDVKSLLETDEINYLVRIARIKNDPALERLDEARKELEEYRKAIGIDQLKRTLVILLNQKETFETDYAEVKVSIASLEDRLTSLSQELAKRERIESLKKSIDAEPLMMEATRPELGQLPEWLKSIYLESEYLNPVYQDLEVTYLEASDELTGSLAQKKELEQKIESLRGEIDSVEKEIATKELTLDKYQDDFDLALDEYSEVHKTSLPGLEAGYKVFDQKIGEIENELKEKLKEQAEKEIMLDHLTLRYDQDVDAYKFLDNSYNQSTVRILEKFQYIRILERAIPPSYPAVSRKNTVFVVALFAFIIACLLVLIQESIRKTRTGHEV